ncbi:MAG TPA: MFS transporter [Burkholderiales bacterium]|nr:MFS transporter [Burkholderiales bacterium]
MTATPRLQPFRPAFGPDLEARICASLILARAIRSVSQGLLVVDFTLYLNALGWSAAAIGGLLASALAVQAGLTLLAGPLSDHWGRRRFLLAYELLLIAAAALSLASTASWAIAAAAIMGGFGRGMNGAAGPFAPVEQAWLARVTPFTYRGKIFSLNTALGSFGMGLGALLAATPALWQQWLPGAAAYRPLFGVVLISALATGFLVFRLTDTRGDAAEEAISAPLRHEENRRLINIAWINALNGAGIGLVGPLMAYWFHLRFGLGPAHIGPMMATGFVATGCTALAAGRFVHRHGMVTTVVAMRSFGLLFLLLLPFAPTFTVGAVLYILRAACTRGTAGARQALNMSLVSDARRGLAATVSALSMQLPRTVGPIVAGAAFGAGYLTAPFLAAAALQGASIALYRVIFRKYEAAVSDKHRKMRSG